MHVLGYLNTTIVCSIKLFCVSCCGNFEVSITIVFGDIL